MAPGDECVPPARSLLPEGSTSNSGRMSVASVVDIHPQTSRVDGWVTVGVVPSPGLEWSAFDLGGGVRHGGHWLSGLFS